MVRPTYIEDHHRDAIRHHELEEITLPDAQVRSFRLAPPSGGRKDSVLITFTPEGLILQGPLGPTGTEGNGVLSAQGCDLAWFCRDLTDEQLLDPFFARKVYQDEVAARDILTLSAGSPLDPDGLRKIAEDLLGGYDQGLLMKTLMNLGYSREDASAVGVDYPLSDAGWICAIHQRFMELRQQVS